MSENNADIALSSSVEEMEYRNPALAVDDRVNDLLQRMTLEEKVAQMLCIWGAKKSMVLDEKGNFDPSVLEAHLPLGIGQIARISDTAGGKTAKDTAVLANQIQRFFVEQTRLGIPVIFHEECLHGLAGKEATSYPQPIGLASTFNPALIETIYSSIAEDVRSRGAHQSLTPVVDVAREPRWGRVEETFGEDPYLVAQMGIAAVKGFQGDATFKDKKHLIATLKHFAAHGQPESGTNCAPVNISERVLRDTYLYTFYQVIKHANALSVMASYNEIDGVPSHANQWLLRTVLRKEWGFKGYVVSDYYAISELHKRDEAISHTVAVSKADAARLAVEAGVNMEYPDQDCYPLLVQLVKDGLVSESLIDELVAPLLRYKFELRLFDDPYVDPDNVNTAVRLEQERALALTAAHETITLLKNDAGTLPLSKDLKKIAVIGPNADRKMLGGYSGEPKYYTSVLQGIVAKVCPNAEVTYSEGCKLTVSGTWNDDLVRFADPKENKTLIREAVEVARQADVVIMAIGDNELISREAWNKTHMGDRADLDLFGSQKELMQAVADTGKPIVVVLFSGRPISITSLQTQAHAILECWYLGQETGNAIADVLFGDFTPGGKLPISIPRSVGHIPAYYNYKPSARRGYLADDVTPLYPFGFGLSYTTFEFSNLRLEKCTIAKTESTRVLVDVKNTGARHGTEVVQMYVRDCYSSVTRPVKELRGFKKVALGPGESTTVALPITPEELAFTTISMEYAVEAGAFDIMVGSSSQDADLQQVTLSVQ